MNTQKDIKRSNEPPVWLMFGAGGTVIAIFFPILIFVLGLLVPFGLVPMDNIVAFAHTCIGKLFILVITIFPVWSGMHRVHHGMHDLKIHIPAGGYIFYGLSALFSILVIFAVFQL